MPDAEIREQIQRAEAHSGCRIGSANVSGMKNEVQSVSSEPILNYFVELAKTYADDSKKYSQQSKSGMLWIELSSDDWILEDDKYKYVIDNLIAVAGIFKGSWEEKTKVVCDYTITDNKTIIYSNNVFEGYVLGTNAIIAGENALRYSADSPAITISNGVAVWSVMHNLNTQNVIVSLYNSLGQEQIKNVSIVSVNSLTVTFKASSNVTAGSYKIVVKG